MFKLLRDAYEYSGSEGNISLSHKPQLWTQLHAQSQESQSENRLLLQKHQLVSSNKIYLLLKYNLYLDNGPSSVDPPKSLIPALNHCLFMITYSI